MKKAIALTLSVSLLILLFATSALASKPSGGDIPLWTGPQKSFCRLPPFGNCTPPPTPD